MDLKFLAGDQWPNEIRLQREAQNRPCLTINRLPQFVNQVANTVRVNPPAIKAIPAGGEATAGAGRGLLRPVAADPIPLERHECVRERGLLRGRLRHRPFPHRHRLRGRGRLRSGNPDQAHSASAFRVLGAGFGRAGPVGCGILPRLRNDRAQGVPKALPRRGHVRLHGAIRPERRERPVLGQSRRRARLRILGEAAA